MGDLAVGARSGQDGPEEQRPAEPGSPPAEDAVPAESDPGAPGLSGSGSGDSGDDTAQDLEEPGHKPRKQRSFWKELPLLIGIALVLALLIKTFLVQAFSIPSDSMQHTLEQGDRVLVDKLTPWFGSEPERGEVVVFHDPADWLAGEPTVEPNPVQRVLGWIGLMPSANEKDLIKRVIGVAGDTVECKGTGPLKVNGQPLNDASFVYSGNTPCSVDDQGGQFKVTVPKGKIWVMGDHRQNSLDSRYHQEDKNQGFVPVGNVVGRAIVVAWPPTRWNTLPIPDTFDQNLSAAAPGALGLAGAVPLVLWRRRRAAGRTTTPITVGNSGVPGSGTAG
ncbi:signal peptidase I [Streptomyces sp. WI04-05B]|uniref:signal peptidase I n=1 Tax=Streptomyces TaxID=1883 RepID=UPI0029BAD43D|nr:MULTISPECIES: signal peptidase I [unclassified Streptomyces]MDX2541934.1 signal peptidase I [Streptomyces sp. WI04-05B]MDX2587016.1 signal peptidase I [Streptomyces sp. WI04-05A]MDX3749984.1 signal peptidase I [Streptomyces sp. AK08-02]